ncbi:MAG: hypothetical protein JNM70_10530, partial [Anaerolineae bacterium]|nr:hypothetical protein [Anaerolineae bacterium]
MRSVRISRREWRGVFVLAAVLIVLTTLPYLIGWAQQGADWRFSGFLFGVDDGFSYLGKMRLGARGILDFYLFYTPEPHARAALVFLPYILPGWLVGRFVSEQDPALVAALTITFHLMRIVFNGLLIVVLYRFIAVFIRSRRARLLALLLATVGGGLGWLTSLTLGSDWLGSVPPEFYIPEGFGFLILLGLPHLALARAALLGGFLFLFRALDADRPWRDALAAGLCWCGVGLIVPFYLTVIYAILAAWGAAWWLTRRQFPLRLAVYGAAAAGLTLPLFAYFAWVFSANPVFAAWSAQNKLPSPHPLLYAVSYGPLVILAGIGLIATRHAVTPPARSLLIGWPLIVPVLVYLPMIAVQRRLAEAVIVPLAILAAAGLRVLRRRIGRWKTRLVIVTLCLSSLLFSLGAFLNAFFVERPLFRPVAEIAMLDWLNQNIPVDGVVL